MEEYREIMEKIKGGLTGEAGYDVPYLMAKAEEYKSHVFGGEIIKECMRMAYPMLPEKTREELSDAIEADSEPDRQELRLIRQLIAKTDFGTALKKAAALAEKADRNPLFREDAVSRYFNFSEPFEEVLYHSMYGEAKDIREAGFDYREIYLLYGSLLVELGRPEEAGKALEKALAWNPVSTDTLFEYAETFKMRDDMKRFREVTEEAALYAFRPKSFARTLRNFGFYFIEKEEWAAAKACYCLSLAYEPESRTAEGELIYIDRKTGGRLENPTVEEIEDISEKFGFPMVPGEHITDLSFELGRRAFQQGNLQFAEYFLVITEALRSTPEGKEMLERCRKQDLQEP